MRINDLVKIEQCKAKSLRDPFEVIEKLASGTSVLNVGAAGGVLNYLPQNKTNWLHYRLSLVAQDLVGIDIDSEGIKHAENYGYKIINANCETEVFQRKFDLIVLSDVIEHLNAPVTAVVNLMNHLTPKGTLCITTPNAMSGVSAIKILLKKNPNVYWDHVACYMPEHIQSICDRFGFRFEDLFYFDHIDRRSRVLKFKSYIARGMSALNPRLSTSFLAVIRNV